MRFDGGWIKLHRSILTSEIQGDAISIALFTILILWANIKETRSKGKPVLRGQILTSLAELEQALGVSRPTVCRRLRVLVTCGMIVRDVKRSGVTITICNYEKYQSINNEQEGVSETILKRSRNDPETILKRSCTHIEELKNPRREEGEKESLYPPPPSSGTDSPLKTKIEIQDPEILKVAAQWWELAKIEMHWKSESGEWSLQGFARSIAKIGRATDLNPVGLKALIDFIENDDFWRKNAISPNGLLTKSKNGNRKVDNILARMKPTEDPIRRAMEEFLRKGETNAS